MNQAADQAYMSLVVDVLGYGTVFVNAALLAGLAVFLVERFTGWSRTESWLASIENTLKSYSREIALGQALVATLGSLYLSNILGWEPCRLCWFQRLAIYPTAVLLGVAVLLEKDDAGDYIIPLAVIGIPVSAYHYVIQRIEQFHSAGCSVLSVSCETTYTFYAGYVSIPFMALTAMVVILLLVWRFPTGRDG